MELAKEPISSGGRDYNNEVNNNERRCFSERERLHLSRTQVSTYEHTNNFERTAAVFIVTYLSSGEQSNILRYVGTHDSGGAKSGIPLRIYTPQYSGRVKTLYSLELMWNMSGTTNALKPHGTTVPATLYTCYRLVPHTPQNT